MQLLERKQRAAVAAAGEDSPLANRQIEIAPFTGFLEIAIEGSAAGLEYDCTVGGRQVALSTDAGASNALPVVPDMLAVIDEEVYGGERIFLLVRNPTAGALTPFIHVRLSTQKRAA